MTKKLTEEPSPAVAADVAPVVEPVTADDLDVEIAKHEAALVALRTRKVAASIQHYPKMRYKAEATVEKSIATAHTVLDARAEAEAAADGYVYDGPTGGAA